MTPKLHPFVDVGISILNSLNTDHTRPHATGLVLLPSSLYKIGPAKMREIHKNSLLPKCKVDAKSGNTDDSEMNKIKYRFDGPHSGNEELFENSYQEVETGQQINQIMSSPHGYSRLHKELTARSGNF